jgi:hypothetical protein
MAWSIERDDTGALLFMGAVMVSMDCMSSLNSSPWTSETFGASPEKAASSREYVMHAVIVSTALSLVSASIAESWWPIVGVAATNGYLYWIYERALRRGSESGKEGWGK